MEISLVSQCYCNFIDKTPAESYQFLRKKLDQHRSFKTNIHFTIKKKNRRFRQRF